MGLLDDLKNQADSKRASEQDEAARKAEREQFYREKILPRMIKAYQFFNELIEHLNYVNLETIVNYPLLADGKLQPLRQEGYKVVIDSSKALKRIDVSMEGVLDNPIEFEIFGMDAVMKHADRIERYSFRHDRKDKKDPASMETVSARFILQGPLPLKVTIEADVDESKLIVTVRNFNEPGFTKYTLSVEQFSDEFLDQLGKFVLRKEDRLFGKSEELSEAAKKQLRDRMIVEARLREQELLEAEERRKAEEEAERQKSAKEQFKRVVNTTVAQSKENLKTRVSQGKESLKGMFTKLKKQAGLDSTAPSPSEQPATASPQVQAPVPPVTAKPQAAKPAAAAAATTAKTPGAVTATATIPGQQVPVPPVQAATQQTQQVEANTAPPKKPIATPAATDKPVSDPTDATKTANPFLPSSYLSRQKAKNVTPSAGQTDSKPEDYIMSAPIKTAAPNPTRHPQKSLSSKPNPFLKPEDLEEVAAAANPADSDAEGSASSTETPIQKKPVLKPGELNTSLADELVQAKLNKQQDEQASDESKPTESTAATEPADNPFLTSAGVDTELSAQTRVSQATQKPESNSSSVSPVSATAKANPGLKQGGLKQAELNATKTSSLINQPKEKNANAQTNNLHLQSEAGQTNVPANPAQVSAAAEDTKPTTPSETDEAAVTRQNPALELAPIESEAAAGPTDEAVRQAKEPAKPHEVDEAAITTQNPALELAPVDTAPVEGPADERELEVEAEIPADVANDPAISTQNPDLQQELLEADRLLSMAQTSVEPDKQQAPAEQADPSTVRTKSPALEQDEVNRGSSNPQAPTQNQQASQHDAHPATADPTEILSLEQEELDIDISANLNPAIAPDDSEEKS
jgi:hypothetical protein